MASNVPSLAQSLSMNIILSICLYLNFSSSTTVNSAVLGGSFATGFDTDFGPAKRHIQLEQRKFYGPVVIDDDGGMYMANLDPIRYFGDPDKHPDVDGHWKHLIDGRFFRITEQEAQEAWGENYQQYWHHEMEGYVVGLEMFHTLHCLDYIRTTFWPEKYFASAVQGDQKANNHMKFHRDHCLEALRQYVMCHGDLSPIPSVYYKGLGRNYNNLLDVSHTCRNFDMIRDWQMARYNGSGVDAVPRKPKRAPLKESE
ncbi:Cyclochlorotine biosynthesis protein O [Colletotrichum orbiculare MAFF 240422]|uniref:Cyclochlorotine biosynthesis protein O n=1 Tax=Colletotrichum orbiculare (strain 104-T / ATCC 96160 / CBS 514.97 / LARS 414 / MAFF 240422) TaxID=1213857 RepID=A0A484FAN0_COLOR|nr:Cyclochlorotine biosynthesis protein O [Colletotrichum orbiculare MAFF 240422]